MSAYEELRLNLGRDPGFEELTEEMYPLPEEAELSPVDREWKSRVHAARVGELLLFAQDRVPIEPPIIEIEERPPKTISEFLLERMKAVLDSLEEVEKRILELRFGLLDGQVRTLEEVSKQLACSRVRVQEIEARALRKLRLPDSVPAMRPKAEGLRKGCEEGPEKTGPALIIDLADYRQRRGAGSSRQD